MFCFYILQVKEIAEQYYCQNQRSIKSYGDTLNQIQNLHNNFRKDLSSKLSDSQESLANKFDDYIVKANKANKLLQTVRKVCEPFSGFVSFFTKQEGNCFGHNIPELDLNQILKANLGKGDVQGALRGVIQIIDPKEDVSKLEVKGSYRTFFYLYNA